MSRKRKRNRPRAGDADRAREQAVPSPAWESVVSGFFETPSRWTDPHFAVELERRGRPLDELLDIAEKLHDRPFRATDECPMFVLTEFTRATKTHRAVELLVRSGYGPQACALARTLFESAVAIDWALLHPQDVDERIRLHGRFIATVEWESWARSGVVRVPPPTPDLTTEERRTAEEWFGGARGTGFFTGHKTIKSLVDDVVEDRNEAAGGHDAVAEWLASAFAQMLGLADRLTHSNGLSTATSALPVLEESPVGEYSSGPSIDYLKQAMLLAGGSFEVILARLLPVLDPELVDELDGVTSRGWRSFKPIDQLLGMTPDSRCICDAPLGTWEQCHGRTTVHADSKLEQRALREFVRAHRPGEPPRRACDWLGCTSRAMTPSEARKKAGQQVSRGATEPMA